MQKLIEMNVQQYVEQLVSEWLVVDDSKAEKKNGHRRGSEHEDAPVEKEIKQ